MNLTYFKADIGNFGDDLNLWLWPQLLGSFDEYPANLYFVGIGSILDHRILENKSNKKTGLLPGFFIYSTILFFKNKITSGWYHQHSVCIKIADSSGKYIFKNSFNFITGYKKRNANFS